MSTNLQSVLADREYKNWLRTGLSLKYAREGILSLVKNEIDNFHQYVLTLLAGSHCNSCQINPTRGVLSKSCKVCDTILTAISKEHRYKPAWKNTDCQKWCSDSWQLAKCYMAGGYASKVSAADTDISGLLNVIINNRRFDKLVNDNMGNKSIKNIFCQARDVRNAVMHNEDMRITDTDLANYIQTLQDMLSNPKCSTTDIKDAQARLTEIKNGSLFVTTEDIDDIKAEACRAIEEKTQEALLTVNKSKEEAKTAVEVNQQNAEIAIKQTGNDVCRRSQRVIEGKKRKAMADISSKTATSVTAVKKVRVAAECAVKQTAGAACRETQTVLDEKKQDILSVVSSQELSSVAAVNKARVEAESAIQKQKPKDSRMAASALQKHLISIYKVEMSTPLSPMSKSDDMSIEELYVKPNMKLINPKKEPKDKGVPINSYQDIFKDESKKEIYVLGDAGMGKTAFCQKMVSTWRQVHSETIDNKSKDQLAMAKFDFLFYVSLRDNVSKIGVEEMIKQRLTKFQDQLPEVLENEKCLIILNGLDEWTTENTDARSSSINKGIPDRQGITNCTFLTTTRPSKFEAIQLKATEIDTKIQLLGIEQLSSEELIESMIGCLNEKYDKQKLADECLKALRIKSLLSFMSIPVILKQLVCLWYFGKLIGTTKCAIYSQMFELYLDIADSTDGRLNKDPEFKVKKEEWKNSKVQLPSCFDDNPKCKQFKPLIVALSNFSFETLVSDNQESSLVFNHSQAKLQGLTLADVNISLKIGILSQNKLMVDCISQMKMVSFIHKSYQEFLAALFVFKNQSDPEQFSKIIKRINKDFDLENVLSFISGMCSSETTCIFVNSCGKINQTTLESCLKEGWRCNHDNKHLQCDMIEIDTKHQPEPPELLCQANIHHMKILDIRSRPTAQCLEYLLQVDTLETMIIGSPSSSSNISEDDLYSIIQHNTHTLTWLGIGGMTLRSRTQLAILLYNIQHLSEFDIYRTTMSQQLQDSLQEFQAQRPDIVGDIDNCTILPDTECTD